MAINQVFVPRLNPLQFSPKTPVKIPQYNSRDLDDYPFLDRIYPWQEQVIYKAPWQTSDVIPLQFESNFAPIQLDLFNVLYKDPMVTLLMSQVGANPQMPGWYIYQAFISLAGLEPGDYYVKLSPGSDPAAIEYSEPLLIVDPPAAGTVEADPTVLMKYKHSHFHGDVIFETGIEFALRVQGAFGKIYASSQDTFYRDNKMNPYQLSSKVYGSFDYSFGGSFGIPDWMIRILTWAWSCDSVTLNGKSYAKDPGDGNGGQAMQIIEEDGYPLKGVNMVIAEGINRASKVIAPTVDTTKKLLVAYNIDGTLFGDMSVNVGDNLIPITQTSY